MDTDNLIQARSSIPFENLKKLIKEKTRFDTNDVLLVDEQVAKVDFEIKATHALYADVKTELIDGNFEKVTSEKQKDEDPELQANNEAELLLEESLTAIHAEITNSNIQYNTPRPATYAKSKKKYYSLSACMDCEGKGNNDCAKCKAKGNVECGRCRGKGSDRCSCSGGKLTCSSCGGDGRDRNADESRNCNSCGGSGDQECRKCNGRGSIKCAECGASGSVKCKPCSGKGFTPCKPCDSTGLTGEAHWAEIGLSSSYKASLLEHYSMLIKELVRTQDHDNLFTGSESFSLKSVDTDSGLVEATYSGVMHVYETKVSVSSDEYKAVSYGVHREWVTLDGVVEKLLTNDLESLQRAINANKQHSIFSAHTQNVYSALKMVVSSESAVDVMEGVVKSGVFSEQYAYKLKISLFEASSLVIEGLAKACMFPLALASAIAFLVMYFLDGGAMGSFAAGFSISMLGLLVYMVFLKDLMKLLGKNGIGARVLNISMREKLHKRAMLIVIAPSLAVIGLLLVATCYLSSSNTKAVPEKEKPTITK